MPGQTKSQLKRLQKRPELSTIDAENVFGFFRDVEPSSKCSDRFISSDYEQAQRFKKSVKAHLLEENILYHQTKQIDEDSLDKHYLQDFTRGVLNFLKSKINEHQQKEKSEAIPPLEIELREQQAFAKAKRKNFTGQKKILQKIERYLSSENIQPLVLYGRSGIGKSSIMAKAIENAVEASNTKVVFRFIGATPASVNTKKLLKSIFLEVGIDVKRDGLPENLRELDPMHISEDFYDRTPLEEFGKRIQKRFQQIKGEVVIFIDALDKLNEKGPFSWFPEELPPNLKMVISVLSNEPKALSEKSQEEINFQIRAGIVSKSFDYEDKNELLLTRLLFRTTNMEYVGDFDAPETLLLKLLNRGNRSLQQHQLNYFLDQFQNAPTPFYVYVAAQEMKHWRSYDLVAKRGKGKKLSDHQQGIVEEFIEELTTTHHHDQQMVQRVLGYLYASQKGLSESEILELLSADEAFVKQVAPNTWHNNINKDLPIVLWTRLLDGLSPFLYKKDYFGNGLYDFFHSEFKDALWLKFHPKQEHENMILAIQKLLKKEASFYNRWGKIYIYLITSYEIAYGSKLQEHSVFIANNNFDEFWLDHYYLGYLFSRANQYKSYNHQEQRHKLVCFLSAAFTLEVLYPSDPNRWSSRYLSSLRGLQEEYIRRHQDEEASYFAEMAFQVIEFSYLEDPEQHLIQYINCLTDLAWTSKDQDKEKTVRLFKKAVQITLKWYSEAPHMWSRLYANTMSKFAVYYRFADLEKSLPYYKAALEVIEIQYEKDPQRWKKTYRKYLSDYSYVLNFELSFLKRMKYYMKSVSNKHWGQKAVRALEGF
jgi:DNA polymerase III delta prime subunit